MAKNEFWGQERGLLSLGFEELCAILALVCLALPAASVCRWPMTLGVSYLMPVVLPTTPHECWMVGPSQNPT